ncbi:TPA: hypothetical protein U1D09_000290 [Streptococcus suis]|nr:hypothetical protein [Streptococcus suis]
MLKQRIQRALEQGKNVAFVFSDSHKLSITEIADEIDLPNWISVKTATSSKVHYVNLEQVRSFEITDKHHQNWSV